MKYKYKKFLKAAYINYDEDYCGCGSSTFIKPTITTPIIVITGNTAIIACAVNGATIYYTLDGSTPTSSSTEYTGAITLTLSCTIKAIAVKPGMTDSAVAEESYVKPITYLTQWKIVGNSQVHTDPFLTSWKVSGNSEVKTLPYPDGVVLPTGYKRCEYLQGDGTAYIEVPFGFYKTDEVYAKAAMLEVGADTYFVSPKTWNDADNRWAMGVHNINIDGTWTIVFTNAYGVQGTSGAGLKPYIVADDVAREWEYKNYICSTGGSVKDNSKITFGSETQNLRLFFGYNTPTQCQIYEYRHKKANTEYRLIPCLDSNDTPCMYDVINGQAYYNSAGSGSFTYKLYPQPTEILSCGDLGQDGKYHVKISNGVDVFDIPLTEPLRKARSASDSIEFSNGTAIITRNIKSILIGNCTVAAQPTNTSETCRWKIAADAKLIPQSVAIIHNIISNKYNSVTANDTYLKVDGVSVDSNGRVLIFDTNFTATTDANNFKNANADVEVIYDVETPIVETIQAPQIAVSPTDTYTSANETPYSAFEHTENKEIWSCGEYNPIDGKYHILVQPLGGSIADIALTEPLRKANDVADSIEFPTEQEGKALVTRNLRSYTRNPLIAISISGDKVTCSVVAGGTPIYNASGSVKPNLMCDSLEVRKYTGISQAVGTFITHFSTSILVRNSYIEQTKEAYQDWLDTLGEVTFIYQLGTPTTELVDAPQIEEADSYSMVISQGAKAVSWSSFETE